MRPCVKRQQSFRRRKDPSSAVIRAWRRHDHAVPHGTIAAASEAYTEREILDAIERISAAGRLHLYRDVELFLGILKARRQARQILEEAG